MTIDWHTSRQLQRSHQPRRSSWVTALTAAVCGARCAGCRQPGTDLCHTCRFALLSSPTAPGPHGVISAGRFDGVMRDLVLGLKFGNRRTIAAVLARHVVRRVGAHPQVRSADLVTWAPTSGHRRRRRGYDQAELIARAVAAELGVPCRRLLYRAHRPDEAHGQTGRTRSERLTSVGFRATFGQARQPPLRVLVIDDVVTTGATLGAAVAALRAVGIHHVVPLAVCAAGTPMPARARRAPIGLAVA